MAVVSIIVTIYNLETYMAECIESLQNQTMHDIEIILVNDGSKDGSGAICDRYAEKDSRIKVIHKENGGVSAARNLGMRVASGEYLAFVDGDDYVAPDMYEKMLKALQKENADVAICSCSRIDEQGNLRPDEEYWCLLPNMIVSGKEIINTVKIPEDQQWLTVIACNRLCKRKVYDNLVWKEGKVREDEFFFMDFYERIGKAVCLSEPLYLYRVRNESITSEKNLLFYLGMAEALNLRINSCMDKGYLEGIPVYERKMYTSLKQIIFLKKQKKTKVKLKDYIETERRIYKAGRMSRLIYLKRRIFFICFGVCNLKA